MLSVNVQLASRGIDGNAAGTYDPHYDSTPAVAVSADGRYVAFGSKATNLVGGLSFTPDVDNIYRYDRLTGAVELVSINKQGTGGADGFCGEVAISADGSVVTYLSTATNLHPLDSDAFSDIFARNFATNTTHLVSINTFGNGGGRNTSRAPVISADGTVIAFRSYSQRLHPLDLDTNWDIYARNLVTGTTQLVTVNYAGTGPGNDIGAYSAPVISANGRMVGFSSTASNLYPGDNNNDYDAFARDLSTGVTHLVSMNAAGTGSGNYASGGAVFSANGNIVAFTSSSNLDPMDKDVGDSERTRDIYVRNLTTSITQLVSVNKSGTNSGNYSSESPSISADGTLVAFESFADDLMDGQFYNDDYGNVFVRNLSESTTQLVSVNSEGTGGGNYRSEDPQISADGRVVIFHSTSSNLHPADTEFDEDNVDIYARDLTTGKTALVSINPTGTSAGNGESIDPVVSADGSVVAFSSRASNLAGPDVNGISDAFVATISFNAPELLGDYNRDGVVDMGDYVMWRKTMGTAIDHFVGADGSGNGIVGAEDYGVWRAHFGETLAAVASAPAIVDEVSVAAADAVVSAPQPESLAVAFDGETTKHDRPLGRSSEADSGRNNEKLLAAITSLHAKRAHHSMVEKVSTPSESDDTRSEVLDQIFAELSDFALKSSMSPRWATPLAI